MYGLDQVDVSPALARHGVEWDQGVDIDLIATQKVKVKVKSLSNKRLYNWYK